MTGALLAAQTVTDALNLYLQCREDKRAQLKLIDFFLEINFFVQFTHQTNYPRYKHLTKSVNKLDEIITVTDQKTRPAAFCQPSWYFIRLFLPFSHLPGGGKLLNSASSFTGFHYWH